MAIKENMLSIIIPIAEGAIHFIVVAIFTEIIPEAAMPCQKLCHVKINMTVSPFNPTFYIPVYVFMYAYVCVCVSFILFPN